MQVIGLQAGASAPSAVIVDASLATINTETAAHTTAAPEASNATTPHALIQIVSPESVAAGARDVSTLVRTPASSSSSSSSLATIPAITSTRRKCRN